jgi:hypothetical protein
VGNCDDFFTDEVHAKMTQGESVNKSEYDGRNDEVKFV